MKKLLTGFLFSFFLFGTVAVCSAVGFTVGNLSVTEHSSGDGLLIQTRNIISSGDVIELLNIGDSRTVDLFRIWTNEEDVANPEDTASKPISVAMSFSQPTPFSDTIKGETYGYRSGFLGYYQGGRVVWASPVDFSFGSGGILNVALTDRSFNDGEWWGVDEGRRHGAIVQGTFTYGSASDNAPVPEPSTILLMGAGLLGLVAVGRRKFNPKK